MRRDAEPETLARLDGFLTALAAAERPWSTLNWLVHGAGAPVLSELLQGRRELSHDALDKVGSAGVYLRAAFVEHGALGPRSEADLITSAIDRELQRLPSGQAARTCGPTRTGRSSTTSPVESDAARRPFPRRSTRAPASTSPSI
jgi:hypothetical protein